MDQPRPSTEWPRSPTLVDVSCTYTFLTGTATADPRAPRERQAARSVQSRSRSRQASSPGAPASALDASSLVARGRSDGGGAPTPLGPLWAWMTPAAWNRPPTTTLTLHNSKPKPARMSRPNSWFVKNSQKPVEIDASMLRDVNVPGHAPNRSSTASPAIVVDAQTLGSVNVPGGIVTLTADDLARVNVPTGDTPATSRRASRVLEVRADDLAAVNVPSGENSASVSRRASRVVEVSAHDLAAVNQAAEAERA